MRPSMVLSEVGIGLRRNLTMTIAMMVTMALSLTLVGTGLLVGRQVEATKGFWYDKIEVTVYLCGQTSPAGACGGAPVSEAERQAIGDELRGMPQVQKVYYESQQDAYARFKKQFSDSPDLVDNVSADALPESYRVKLKDPKQFEVVASALRGTPGVDSVQDQKALLQPFFNALDKMQQFAWLLAGAEIIAAVLLVSNTIRVSAFSRRRETGIMRLVGASNLSIQLPFVIEGLLAGLVGAGVASGALAAVKYFAIDRELRRTFRFTVFVQWQDVLGVMPWLFVIGTVLAGLASFLTLRRHLRV